MTRNLSEERKNTKMAKVSDKTIEFLKRYIRDLKDYLPLDEDKLYDLMKKVENDYVIPLSNAAGDGQCIDEVFLDAAEDVMDELNVESFDFKDFNSRIG